MSLDSGKPEAPPSERWNGRFSITITLATAISLLVLVSVGSVLGVGVWLAGKNTLALMGQNANQGIANGVERLEQHLRPAEDQARFIARRIEKGEIDPGDRAAFGRLLTGALAGVRQIEAVSYFDERLVALTAARRADDNIEVYEADLSRDAQIRGHRPMLAEDPQWAAPVWRDEHKKTFFNLVHPVRLDGRPIGAMVAIVSIRELSAFVRRVGKTDPGTRFILYGRDRVLAHPTMVRGYPGLSVANPLPRLAGFRDPVLAAMWDVEERFDLLVELAQGTNGHGVQVGGEDYVFMYRRLHGYGPKPLMVGAYFRVADIAAEMRRMVVSIVVGIAALLLAIVAAVILGRRIARPIV
ncbi:MAG: cache domain-containing protein, partial [Rhodospirillaceae bacterium]|nr:cache domain-containing protein [Rhodospirillaceae bacterium]